MLSQQFSPIIAGCMKWGQWGAKFNTAQYASMIDQCIDEGITTFDHADIYGDYTVEEEFGAAINGNNALRAKMQLITKCGIMRFTPNKPEHRINHYNTSTEHIIRSAERSLLNFRTDHIDVLLIHRPDPLMHPDDIATAFNVLRQQGKVRYFGVSNFTPSQVSMTHERFPVQINQIEISVIHLDPFHNGQLDQCIKENILPMAWSPVGAGRITEDSTDERIVRINSVASLLAKKYQTTADSILLAFLTTHPSGIIPVLGTTKIERLRHAMQSYQLRLVREEWFMLWRASAGHEVP